MYRRKMRIYKTQPTYTFKSKAHLAERRHIQIKVPPLNQTVFVLKPLKLVFRSLKVFEGLAPVRPTGRPSQKRPSLSTGRAHPSVKIISKVARRTGPVRRRVTAVFDG
ncbi:hypothetical protein B0H10DRAFT_1963595 [Mycena sp. CBHHK59/15]|nr:hypothetical protein B0H10DRAFT_1963595 [Mycena sp. CBHHK59/15]